MKYRNHVAALFAFLLLYPAAAASASDRSAMLDAVTKCRTIPDDGERVRCYDQSVELLQRAESKGEVAIIEPKQVREANRRAFGLARADTSPFGRAADGAEIDQIEGSVSNAQVENGAWVIQLNDGSSWRQTDAVELGQRVKAGAKVVVKKAALGSYRLTISGSPGIKVRRER